MLSLEQVHDLPLAGAAATGAWYNCEHEQRRTSDAVKSLGSKPLAPLSFSATLFSRGIIDDENALTLRDQRYKTFM